MQRDVSDLILRLSLPTNDDPAKQRLRMAIQCRIDALVSPNQETEAKLFSEILQIRTKGMLSNFSRQGSNLAEQLENMGDSGILDMGKVTAVYDNLNILTKRIIPKIKEHKLRFEGKQ